MSSHISRIPDDQQAPTENARAEVTAIEAVDSPGRFADPVFVLCNGRSGSTLLRFLLDAHPQIACPPETNLPALCAQLATVWSLIEGAPLSANRGDEPPAIPDAAIAGVRATMDRMVGSYLDRRHKSRYCDKSLGTARFAELLTRVYPQARFICLYRHPMDVIASGLEACPWGLNGYGFDPYIASAPGNAVMALARFWIDNVEMTLAAEAKFPGCCLRVRYEDLVSDPEGIAAGVFEFLGVAPFPKVSEACFSAGRERSGPADYKIWYTSKVSTDSIGRGWSVPTTLIAPQVLATMNELAAQLGYLAVGDSWGTTAPPADVRVAGIQASPPAPAVNGSAVNGSAVNGSAATGSAVNGSAVNGSGVDLAEQPASEGTGRSSGDAPRSGMLSERLLARLASADSRLAARWEPHEAEKIVVVWVPGGHGEATEYWLVDLKGRTVTLASSAAQEDSDWDVIGSADAWERVTGGDLNLSVAFRTCQLRYCDSAEAGPLASEARLGILANLLGVTDW